MLYRRKNGAQRATCGFIKPVSSGEMAAVSKSTFDLRIGLVKLKCFKEYNTQIITGLIVDL